MKRIEPPGSAGFPACGFWGLSSPQSDRTSRDTELESSANPQAGKPAPHPQWRARCFSHGLVICVSALVLLAGCAVGPNYKPPQTSVAPGFVNTPTNAASADEAVLARWW